MAARTLNILLGIWLFISAFVWAHSGFQLASTWISGVVCVVIALVASRLPAARFLNAVLGGWVIVSAFVFEHGHATLWNNVLVGIAILLLALTPSERLNLPAHTTRTA